MKDRFPKLRSELWWNGREFFEKRDSALWGTGWAYHEGYGWKRAEKDVIWRDEYLAAELGMPTFGHTSNGKIQVEEKDKTKKRTGEGSPNRADAFLLTLAGEAVTAAGTEKTPVSWNQPIQREIKGIV